jgi:hypothetical protein
MHLENAVAVAFTPAGVLARSGLVEALAAAMVDAGVLPGPTVAAVGLPELAPHPATRTRMRRIATARARVGDR